MSGEAILCFWDWRAITGTFRDGSSRTNAIRHTLHEGRRCKPGCRNLNGKPREFQYFLNFDNTRRWTFSAGWCRLDCFYCSQHPNINSHSATKQINSPLLVFVSCPHFDYRKYFTSGNTKRNKCPSDIWSRRLTARTIHRASQPRTQSEMITGMPF